MFPDNLTNAVIKANHCAAYLQTVAVVITSAHARNQHGKVVEREEFHCKISKFLVRVRVRVRVRFWQLAEES